MISFITNTVKDCKAVMDYIGQTFLCYELIFVGLLKHSECQDTALGMESRNITDGQISASSEWNDSYAAVQGRLNFKQSGNKQGAWSADTNDANQWLQVDLIGQYIVTRVATQGGTGHDEWVTEYKIQYGDDGKNFQYHREQGKNTDKVKKEQYCRRF